MAEDIAFSPTVPGLAIISGNDVSSSGSGNLVHRLANRCAFGAVRACV